MKPPVEVRQGVINILLERVPRLLIVPVVFEAGNLVFDVARRELQLTRRDILRSSLPQPLLASVACRTRWAGPDSLPQSLQAPPEIFDRTFPLLKLKRMCACVCWW